MVKQSVISIGNFDGVHRGHGAILDAAGAVVRRLGAKVVAMTFDPHPATVLSSGAAPQRLMSLAGKRRALLAAGADHVIVLESTLALLGEAPDQFVQWLCDAYQPVAIVEGSGFRFGKGRRGDLGQLRQMGGSLGFEVVEVGTYELALSGLLVAPVSSSLIRWLVACGRVADAALCLGRPYGLTGRVATGERRGRSIGVPTANLATADVAEFMVPAHGVYAGQVELPGGESHPAAISIGTKPTFGNNEPVIEAHLLDFAGDLSDQTLTVRFARWLRDQQPFPDLAALCRQLGRDIEQTRRWHGLGLLRAAEPRYSGIAAAG